MRRLLTATLVAAFVTPLVVGAQEAEVTANAGFVSQYYYRGAPLKTSSASAGLDVAVSDFSVGTWAADVGSGAEVDLYASYGVDITDDVSVSVGGTGYFYTGEADVTYLEVNLGVGFGPISLEYAGGEYRTSPSMKYSFLAVTAEHEGLFATVGTSAYAADFGDTLGDAFKKDMGLQYLEAGYGFSAADLDLSISGIWNDSDLSLETDGTGAATHEFTLVFGVSKTFSLN